MHFQTIFSLQACCSSVVPSGLGPCSECFPSINSISCFCLWPSGWWSKEGLYLLTIVRQFCGVAVTIILFCGFLVLEPGTPSKKHLTWTPPSRAWCTIVECHHWPQIGNSWTIHEHMNTTRKHNNRISIGPGIHNSFLHNAKVTCSILFHELLQLQKLSQRYDDCWCKDDIYTTAYNPSCPFLGFNDSTTLPQWGQRKLGDKEHPNYNEV